MCSCCSPAMVSIFKQRESDSYFGAPYLLTSSPFSASFLSPFFNSDCHTCSYCASPFIPVQQVYQQQLTAVPFTKNQITSSGLARCDVCLLFCTEHVHMHVCNGVTTTAYVSVPTHPSLTPPLQSQRTPNSPSPPTCFVMLCVCVCASV